ncbi:MAG: BBE domain-containing protein [Acidimicrobiales bacterium]
MFEPLTSSGLAAAKNALAAAASQAPDVGCAFLFDSYGGAISRVAPSASAFVHREVIAGIQMTATWADTSAAGAASSWLASAAQAMAPYTSGAYQNYVDPTLSEFEQAYYGTNLPRLIDVKTKVDPDNFFSFPQSIPIKEQR